MSGREDDVGPMAGWRGDGRMAWRWPDGEAMAGWRGDGRMAGRWPGGGAMAGDVMAARMTSARRIACPRGDKRRHGGGRFAKNIPLWCNLFGLRVFQLKWMTWKKLFLRQNWRPRRLTATIVSDVSSRPPLLWTCPRSRSSRMSSLETKPDGLRASEPPAHPPHARGPRERRADRSPPGRRQGAGSA